MTEGHRADCTGPELGACDCPVAALQPCPFCGVALTPNANQADLYVRRYGTHYEHPATDCHLSRHEVSPSEVVAWNRRAPLGVTAFHITEEPGPAGTSRYRVGPPLNAVYGDEGEARYMIDSYKAIMKTLADRQKRRAMPDGVAIPDGGRDVESR